MQNLKRIMCTVKYDGANFNGYQIQPKGRTVQKEIERALRKVCKKEIVIHSSGRTDAGVHALGQRFHFDSDINMDATRYKEALNRLLPRDIYILKSEQVDSEFHSRFNALTKEYHYKLSTNEYDPLKCNYIHYRRRALNFERMKEAMKYFLGTHDFTSFSANLDDISKVRTIYKAELICDDGEYVFTFIGTGFLKYMVRIMVGTVIQVGEGKKNPEDIISIIEKRDRFFAGPTAKSEGLYLHSVQF